MNWKQYVRSCFPEEDFRELPTVIADKHEALRCRFHTYKQFVYDVEGRGGPIASTTLSGLFKPKVIAEFGIHVGNTLLLLSKLNPEATVYGVDVNPMVLDCLDLPIGFLASFHKCPNVEIKIMNSWEFDMKGKVDLCFIDADHSEEPVWKDCWRAWENRNTDGDWCIAFDDYHPSNQGVTKSVDRFVEEVGYPLQKAWSWYWIGTKTASETELEGVHYE